MSGGSVLSWRDVVLQLHGADALTTSKPDFGSWEGSGSQRRWGLLEGRHRGAERGSRLDKRLPRIRWCVPKLQ